MSRFDDFAYFNDSQIKDVTILLEHQGVTVDVYRPSTSTKPGFQTELGTKTRVARILMYITSDAEPTQAGTSDMRANLQQYVGITNYTRLRIDDELRIPSGSTYRIRAVQNELENVVQVLMERVL